MPMVVPRYLVGAQKIVIERMTINERPVSYFLENIEFLDVKALIF